MSVLEEDAVCEDSFKVCDLDLNGRGSPVSTAASSFTFSPTTSSVCSQESACSGGESGRLRPPQVAQTYERLHEALDARFSDDLASSLLRTRLNQQHQGLKVDTDTAREDGNASSPVQVFRRLGEDELVGDYYEFDGDIYSGSSRNRKDKVMTARRRSDGCELVVKVRNKRKSGAGDRAWREIMSHLSKMSRNAHVLDILEILEDDAAYYIVMPKCSGGELMEFLTVEAEVPESECKRITREMLSAIGHLHAHNIVHRDIKPENLMFNIEHAVTDEEEVSPVKTLKLLDWDTCVKWVPNSPKRRSFAGTPGYIAPEALLGDANPQSDLFSVGVILYILMTGLLPWSTVGSLEDGLVDSFKARKMYKDLQNEVLDWEMDPWPLFPDARDLCQQLLAFDYQQRPKSVEDALAHKWLRLESSAGS